MADSIWKKELGFRKKGGPTTNPGASQPPAVTQPGEKPDSIWKRELRFRKPVELAASDAVSRAEPNPIPDSPEPHAPLASGNEVLPHVEVETESSFALEPQVEHGEPEHPAEPVVERPASFEGFERAESPVDTAQPAAAETSPVDSAVELETESVSEVVQAPSAAVLEPPIEHDVRVAAEQSGYTASPEAAVGVPVEAVAEPQGPTALEPLQPAVSPEAPAETLDQAPAPPRPEIIAVPVATAIVAAPEPDVELEPELPPQQEPAVEEVVPAAPKQSRLNRDVRLPSLKGRKAKNGVVAGSAASHAVKNLVGLRIGSSQLAAACVHNNGTAEVVQLARTRIPRGLVASGEVRDIEGLTRELKTFFSQNKLPRKGVRLGIASNRIGVRVLEVPQVDDPKLFENAMRFHAQEVLPIAVTDAILDYHVLGEGAGQDLEPTVRVLLVFAHKELVERYVEACRRAGVKLDSVDFEAFALLRALAAPRPEEEEPTEAVIAVAVGNERTIFAVSDGRVCDFTRVLEWGSGTLDIALARALNLTPSQAEPIKLALALDGDVAPSQLTPEQVETARSTIRSELQALSRELVSSLQFYQTRSESLDIGAILLSGGGAELTGFAAELERLTGVPVRTGDPLTRVELSKRVPRPAEPGSLAIAIGLGIED